MKVFEDLSTNQLKQLLAAPTDLTAQEIKRVNEIIKCRTFNVEEGIRTLWI